MAAARQPTEQITNSNFLLTEDASYISLLCNENQLIAKPPKTYYNLPMPIENHFDIPFISALALREKQIQQNCRPIIAMNKWFVRRPGAQDSVIRVSS